MDLIRKNDEHLAVLSLSTFDQIFRGYSHRGWYTAKLYPMFAITNSQSCLHSWVFHPHVMFFGWLNSRYLLVKFQFLSLKLNIFAGLNLRCSSFLTVFVGQILTFSYPFGSWQNPSLCRPRPPFFELNHYSCWLNPYSSGKKIFSFDHFLRDISPMVGQLMWNPSG